MRASQWDIEYPSVILTDVAIGSLEQFSILVQLRVGRAAASEFLHARKFDDGPSQNEVIAAHDHADRCRQAVIQQRRVRRARRTLYSILLVCVVVGCVLGYLLVR